MTTYLAPVSLTCVPDCRLLTLGSMGKGTDAWSLSPTQLDCSFMDRYNSLGWTSLPSFLSTRYITLCQTLSFVLFLTPQMPTASTRALSIHRYLVLRWEDDTVCSLVQQIPFFVPKYYICGVQMCWHSGSPHKGWIIRIGSDLAQGRMPTLQSYWTPRQILNK